MGEGVEWLNILRICGRVFGPAYRSQQILYGNEVMRIEQALATLSLCRLVTKL